ncbi:hypothetical protein [Rubrivivax gelatinosus]|uniref:Uncharacterized protein n=1 Tax=Rubrivivax gelatinosus TaxID=28068 RepID=A0A4R2MCT7_RUBGE|nr:hypothetical protein [Rubrivivax gelatinosus]MBK1686396.1 hypothetical protein [Rubrivivax gelatinosus]TCP04380.1 hypothetical protein EV684_102133 [Rubrivivax gelatinosus]
MRIRRLLPSPLIFLLLALNPARAQTTDTDPNAVPTLPPPAPPVSGAPAARLLPPPLPLPQRPPSASQPAGPGMAPGLREPAVEPPERPPAVQDSTRPLPP